MSEGPLLKNSFEFAKQIIVTYKSLVDEKHEFVLSKQLLRCGTSIGAMLREAQNAESNMDFIHKLAVAQKETGEAIYWLDLLHQTGYLTVEQYDPIQKTASEIARMLKSAIITSKNKSNKK